MNKQKSVSIIIGLIIFFLYLLGRNVNTVPPYHPDGMKFIPAEDSIFTMGFQNFIPSSAQNLPTQTVSFTYDFYMDSTEITQKSYDELMEITYSDYSSPLWSSGYNSGEHNPAYYVNWYDAVLFCNARSKSAGFDTVYSYNSITGTPGNNCILSNVGIKYDAIGFRLPTESEWEYACRAGNTSDFYWGKNFGSYPLDNADTAQINTYSVWLGNSQNRERNNPAYGTQRVASKLPNSLGLYDMNGNVWEWCNDWWGRYETNPVEDHVGRLDGSSRIIRGGSWFDHASLQLSSSRNSKRPQIARNTIGFRTVIRF